MEIESLFSDSPFPLFLGTKNACALRATSKKLKSIVSACPWNDRTTSVSSNVFLRWRQCFPCAVYVKITREIHSYVLPIHIISMKGISEVDISGCGISRFALKNMQHLQNAEKVNIAFTVITEEAIALLSSDKPKRLVVSDDQVHLITDLKGFNVEVSNDDGYDLLNEMLRKCFRPLEFYDLRNEMLNAAYFRYALLNRDAGV
jgi:hypothetical protein